MMADSSVSKPFNQRIILCKVLESLTTPQWHAETVCKGWNASHIAAHLIVRERNPFAALGIVFPAFSGFHTRGVAKVSTYPRAWLINRLYDGPPWWTRVGQIHIGEDWIHTQDIVRGHATDADPNHELEIDSGTHPPALYTGLVRACDRFAPLAFRALAGPFRIHLTDGEGFERTWMVRPGTRSAVLANMTNVAPDVTITGSIGELLLTLTGREHVATVTYTGNPDHITTIRNEISGI
ncbi:hypothetical protein [Stomatohabitans albus]|uniref:hypothetical protein n=1 Tax=Stomatohabitans albus TaxID=3110766 RepID=UPI00300D1ADC